MSIFMLCLRRLVADWLSVRGSADRLLVVSAVRDSDSVAVCVGVSGRGSYLR